MSVIPECQCQFCVGKYERDAEGNCRCQGCGVRYPTHYLCSNEVTHRFECAGCYLCWQTYQQHEWNQEEDDNTEKERKREND